MSFLTKIKNKIVGNVAEVYEITFLTTTYYYTNLDYDFTFAGNNYKATTLKRSNIIRKKNDFAGELDLTLPADNEVANIFKSTVSSPVFIVAYTIDKDDVAEEKTLLYTGYINNADFNEQTAKLTCNTSEFLANNTILRYKYTTLCGNDLYSSKCGLSKAAYEDTSTITDVQNGGTTLLVNDIHTNPNEWYTNGYLEFNGQRATIISQIGTTLKLYHPLKSIAIGDTVKIVAGCDRSSGVCKNKFNNFDNFFGFEYVPDRNPFDGQL